MWIKAAASGGLSLTHSIQCDQDEERSYTFLANSWLPAQEAGGSGLGDTVVSLWNTYSSRWFSGLLGIGEKSGDFVVDGAVSRLQDPSAYLDVCTLALSLNLFRKEQPAFHYLISLAHRHVQELRLEHLEEALKKKELPLAIPLVIGPLHALGVPHLVTLYVTENSFCFYDSKGRGLEDFPWYEGKTLHDLAMHLLNCLGFRPDGCLLLQNRQVQQRDVNNCGLFVLRYLYQRGVLLRKHDQICKDEVSWEEICAFRVLLAQKILSATIEQCQDF